MGVFPVSLMQPSDGLGATLESTDARDTFLVQQMHALAIAIYQAKQRNDRVGVQNLTERFKLLANEYALRGNDSTATDRFIIAVGDWVETAVDAIPNAIAALPKAVGFGLMEAAIPFAILFVGYKFLTSSRRRY
jgi:hypothetical protein